MKFFIGIWFITILFLSGELYATPAAQQVIGRNVARAIYTAKSSPYNSLNDLLSKQISAGASSSVMANNITEIFDINADLEEEGIPPLSLAIQLKKPHAMKPLLAAGADLDVLGGRGTSPFGEILASDQLDVALLVAIELEDTELATRLIEAGADVNAISGYASQMEMFPSLSKKNLHIAPILVAAKTGNTSMMKLLYNRGADINSQDINGYGVLDYLASKGDAESYIWALSKGLDPNSNTSLLELVADEKNEEAMIALLENGDFSADTMGRAIITAAEWPSDKSRILDEVLDAGGDANYRIKDGYTPLMVHVRASWSGKNISPLLYNDANPALQDDNGNTVLHIAADLMRGKDVFDPLLEREDVADYINIKNNAGFTALDVAQGNGKGRMGGGNLFRPKGTDTPSAEELLRAAGAKTAAELEAAESE